MRGLNLNGLQRLIVIAIGVLTAIIVVAQFTKGSAPVSDAPPPPTQASVPQSPEAAASTKARSLLKGAPGTDAQAQTLLRNAAIAMETWFAQHGDFAGVGAGIGDVEPNISWVDAKPSSTANQVQISVGPDNRSYAITTTSPTGAPYTYARDANATVTRSCGPGCSW